LDAGSRAIEKFFKEEEKAKQLPTYIEKDFSFALGNNRIIGRWDRVDMEDGEGVIIDFKSSEITTQEAADKRTKESLQLSIYALAYKHIFGKLPSRVELHFLETGLKGSAVLKEKSLDKTIEKIEEAAQGIRKANYPANPSAFVCTYCAYSSICPEAMLK
jgi:DNA helicase-2/ATP-dependent DNA helicase PcrA